MLKIGLLHKAVHRIGRVMTEKLYEKYDTTGLIAT
jgi:hypothetical protein